MTNQNPAIAAAAIAAMGALTKTAKAKDNKLSAPAVAGAKADLIQNMENAIAETPEVQHVTNTEAWWQKRSSWGAIIGPAALLIGMGLKFAGVEYSFGLAEQGLLADALTAIGVLVGAVFSRWAGIATRPLFT